MDGDQDNIWYYTNGQDRKGPVAMSAMIALAEAGVVDSGTMVWKEGMGEWEPAYKHVRGVIPPTPGGAPAARTTASGYAPGPETEYQRRVGFGEAFGLFWKRYTDFGGRSNRGELWWWVLASMLVGLVLGILDFAITGNPDMQPLTWIWSLATLIPNIALGVRRMHDLDRTGWWVLIGVVPIVGWIVLLVFFCQQGTRGPNRFA